MGDFEERTIHNNDLAPNFYLRYPNDYILGQSDGKEEFNKFMEYLSSVHESIKFTCDISDEVVPFFYHNVHLDNGRLWTDLYCKSTDNHGYLRFSSS